MDSKYTVLALFVQLFNLYKGHKQFQLSLVSKNSPGENDLMLSCILIAQLRYALCVSLLCLPYDIEKQLNSCSLERCLVKQLVKESGLWGVLVTQ